MPIDAAKPVVINYPPAHRIYAFLIGLRREEMRPQMLWYERAVRAQEFEREDRVPLERSMQRSCRSENGWIVGCLAAANGSWKGAEDRSMTHETLRRRTVAEGGPGVWLGKLIK